jgi:hypothetical protein
MARLAGIIFSRARAIASLSWTQDGQPAASAASAASATSATSWSAALRTHVATSVEALRQDLRNFALEAPSTQVRSASCDLKPSAPPEE